MTDKNNTEILQYCKFLAIKSAQMVIQSRTRSQKSHTPCQPNSSDWFNVSYEKDLPELPEDIKKRLDVKDENFLSPPLCIEILVHTGDGETMTLELWSIGINHEVKDDTLRIAYTTYNKMSLLLKSLIATSRVTPGYQYTRRQDSNSYTMSNNINFVDPNYNLLGEGYKSRKIGHLSTPVGTISISCSYRTKYALTPRCISPGIMLKSDYFEEDATPKEMPPKSGWLNSDIESLKALFDNEKCCAFISDQSKNDLFEKRRELIKELDSEETFFSFVKAKKPVKSKQLPIEVTPLKEEDKKNGNIWEEDEDAVARSLIPARRSMYSMEDTVPVTLNSFIYDCLHARQLETFNSESPVSEELDEKLDVYQEEEKHFNNIYQNFFGETSENNN